MASKTILSLVLMFTACGGAPRYPLAAPLANDTDGRPVSVSCEERPSEKDAKHVACAPEPYISPLVWDAADNSSFRPRARVLAVDPAGGRRGDRVVGGVPHEGRDVRLRRAR